jgi:hypothetical protein
MWAPQPNNRGGHAPRLDEGLRPSCGSALHAADHHQCAGRPPREAHQCTASHITPTSYGRHSPIIEVAALPDLTRGSAPRGAPPCTRQTITSMTPRSHSPRSMVQIDPKFLSPSLTHSYLRHAVELATVSLWVSKSCRRRSFNVDNAHDGGIRLMLSEIQNSCSKLISGCCIILLP